MKSQIINSSSKLLFGPAVWVVHSHGAFTWCMKSESFVLVTSSKGQHFRMGCYFRGDHFFQGDHYFRGSVGGFKNRCYFKGAIIFWRAVSFWILWYVLLATLVETKDFVSWAHLASPKAQFKSSKAYWWLCSHHNIWFLKLLSCADCILHFSMAVACQRACIAGCFCHPC